MIKAKKLYEKINSFENQELEDIKNLIKIFIARFVVNDYQGKKYHSLELIPYKN
jgi:hypothetical protein